MNVFLRRARMRLGNLTGEYNRPFWILVTALFIDRLGGALIFPFLTLYVTRRFGISMTQVGMLFGIFAIASVVGSTLGGALADRIGRRTVLIVGLVTSAVSSVLLGLVGTFRAFVVVALVVGVFADMGWPAVQAMVADLLPPAKRSGGFGFLRVVANLAIAIGPAIGGLLAARSYLLLFIIDAISSTITALIVFALMPETRPARRRDAPQETIVQSFGGYLRVLRDVPYVTFMLVSVLATMVYVQMNATLPPFLRDVHGVPERGFGFIITLNAAMVVAFQAVVSRRTEGRSPLRMIALGVATYAVGFALYGVVGRYELFLMAMAIVTLGEMIAFPVMQVVVASFAPEDMRGRYMAVFGYTWITAAALGPLLGGLVLDNLNPSLLWGLAGLAGLVSAGTYLVLHRIQSRAVREEPVPAAEVAQAVEAGRQ